MTSRRGGRTYAGGVARIRLGLCQLNTVVGDLDGNVERILAAYDEAEAAGCDVAVFPELAITGYPPEDLVLKPGLRGRQPRRARQGRRPHRALRRGRRASSTPTATSTTPPPCAPAARSSARYQKRLLPNYAVFDEQRYFAPGTAPLTLFEIAGVKVGVAICEDVWSAEGPSPRSPPAAPSSIVIPNGSPYFRGRHAERERMVATRAEDAHCHIVYVNQVGGQDELIFDGGVVRGRRRRRPGRTGCRSSREAVDVVDLDIRPGVPHPAARPAGPRHRRPPCRSCPCPAAVADHPGDARPPGDRTRCSPPVDEVYDALVLATRDYVTKNGFTDVVFGLSGGIDSSLVAADRRRRPRPRARARRVDAEPLLVRGLEDRRRGPVRRHRASSCARSPSSPPSHAFLELLGPSFEGLPEDLTEENLQPRIRGTLLMALSNKFRGWLVLTTGNKSELAVGYSTLYGDTAGGFAVIKDVPKLLVYDLCRLRNERAGPRGHPRGRAHQAAVGRAPPRPARRPVAPALRGARPAARGLRRGRPHPRPS